MSNPIYTCFRVHGDKSLRSSLLDVLGKRYDTFCLAYEIDANRSHFQGIILDFDKKWFKDTMDKLKIPAGNKGRSTSILRKTLPEALSYYMKEDTDFYHQGFFEQDIYEATRQSQKHAQRKLGNSKVSMFKLLCEQIEADTREITVDYIITIVLDYYSQNEKLMSKFQIVSLVQTLCYKFVPYYADAYARDIRSQVVLG